MSADLSNWVIAAATAISAIAVGATFFVVLTQSRLLAEASNDPFTANLQSVQIDVCLGMLGSAAKARSNYEAWSNAVREKEGGSEFIITRLFEQTVTNAIETRAAASRFNLLANEEVQLIADKLSNATFAFLLMVGEGRGSSQSNDSLWFKDFDQAYTELSARCRNVFAGQSEGLIQ